MLDQLIDPYGVKCALADCGHWDKKHETNPLGNGLEAREYREASPHLWSMVGSERAPVAETVLWVGAAEVAVLVPGPTSGWANLNSA